MSAGKQLLASASRGMRLFVQSLADSMVAASNTAQQLAAAMHGGAAGSMPGAIAGLAAAGLPAADLLNAGIKGAAASTGGNMEAAVGKAQRGLSAVSASSSLAAAGGALADMAPPTSVVSLGKRLSWTLLNPIRMLRR